MSVSKELFDVLAAYNIGGCPQIQEINRGYVNAVWHVTTVTGQYVLRRRHPDLSHPDLVAAQHALIEHLRCGGFPTPEIVRTRDAQPFLRRGEKVYELQAYIQGVAGDRTHPIHMAASACTLGRYHRLVNGFDRLAFHRSWARYSPATLTSILSFFQRDGDYPTDRAKQIIAQLEMHAQELSDTLAQFDALPELVIHGDFYTGNIIFQGDKVAGVFDYDQAHWTARAEEVAEATIFFAQEQRRRFKHIVYAGILDLEAVQRFLEAYVSVICLTNEEIEALPLLIRTIWLRAALHPPLKPRLRLDVDLDALQEVAALADWGARHAQEIMEIGMQVSGRQNRR
jgi:homoserine kinase type II